MLKDALARRAFFASICFVLGLSSVFVTLGATASAAGQALREWQFVLLLAGGVLIVLFALHFLGLFRISLFYREARLQAGGGGSYAGAYGMGLAFGFGWTPCIGPILAVILAFAAQEETIAHGVALLAVYSLGLGVPFILAALCIRPFLSFMRRFRRHLGKVEKVMGLLLLVVGISFIAAGADVVLYDLGYELPEALRVISFQSFSAFLLESFPGLANIENLALAEGSATAGGVSQIGVATAFAGGLLSFLSPCVLPLAPPYLAFLAGTTLDQWTAAESGPSAPDTSEAV